MTNSGPSSVHDESSGWTNAAYLSEFNAWVESVNRASRKRASLERLILAKGLFRPVALGQRFVRKSAEVGVAATIKLAVQRLSSNRKSKP